MNRFSSRRSSEGDAERAYGWLANTALACGGFSGEEGQDGAGNDRYFLFLVAEVE